MRSFARSAHQWIILLLLAIQALQFYAAGLLFYARPSIHAVNGWVMLLVTLAAVVAATLGFGRSRKTGVTVLLALCVALQPVLVLVLYSVSIYLSALHPVNGVLIVGLTVWLLTEGRREDLKTV